MMSDEIALILKPVVFSTLYMMYFMVEELFGEDFSIIFMLH